MIHWTMGVELLCHTFVTPSSLGSSSQHSQDPCHLSIDCLVCVRCPALFLHLSLFVFRVPCKVFVLLPSHIFCVSLPVTDYSCLTLTLTLSALCYIWLLISELLFARPQSCLTYWICLTHCLINVWPAFTSSLPPTPWQPHQPRCSCRLCLDEQIIALLYTLDGSSRFIWLVKGFSFLPPKAKHSRSVLHNLLRFPIRNTRKNSSVYVVSSSLLGLEQTFPARILILCCTFIFCSVSYSTCKMKHPLHWLPSIFFFSFAVHHTVRPKCLLKWPGLSSLLHWSPIISVPVSSQHLKMDS